METPAAHRSFRRRLFSPPATTPDTVTRSSFLSQVWLHDWWLIRADSDSHGQQIGVGGFAFRDCIAGPRRFFSAPIVKRQDAVTLKTVDGITVIVVGSLNKSQSLENGFSHEVCDHFVIGFPYYWEEFADLSVREERVESCVSKGVPCSDAYKTTSPGNHGPDTFDSTPNEASSGKEEALQPIPSMVSYHNTPNTKRKRSDVKSVIGDSKGVPCSDAYKTTSPGNHGPDTFDSTPSEKKETLQPNTKKKSSDVKSVLGSGPLTRSRATSRRSMRLGNATKVK